MKIKSIVTVGMMGVLFLGSAVTALGAGRTCVWTGTHNTSWSHYDNWEDRIPPDHFDIIIFPDNDTARKSSYNDTSGKYFTSITFEGSGYILSGNSLEVTFINDTSASLLHGNKIDFNIGQSSLTITKDDPNQALTITGKINIFPTLLVTGNGTTVLSGKISGYGGIVKQGSGTLELAGTVGNTYENKTEVHNGVLLLNSSEYPLGTSGQLRVGNGYGNANTAIARGKTWTQLGGVSVTFNKDGWLDVGSFSEEIGALTFNNGGHLSALYARLDGAVTVKASPFEAIIDGKLSLQNDDHQFVVEDGEAAVDLRANVSFYGYDIVKTGDGLMELCGNSAAYYGSITVNQGILRVSNDDALGSSIANRATVVTGSGLIQLNGVHVMNEELILSQTTGTLLSVIADSSWAGVISGAGGLVIDGPGDLILAGAANNTYTGATQVKNNRLILNKSNNALAISQGSLTIGDGTGLKKTAIVQELAGHQIGSIPVLVDEDGLLDLNNCDDTIGNLLTLKNGGNIQTGTGTLTLLDNNQILCTYSPEISSVFHGKLNIGNGTCAINLNRSYLTCYASISGSGDIQVMSDSASSLSLNAANTFTGTLTVGGTARVSVADSLALGSAAGGTVINDQASLRLYNDLSIAEPLTMNSSYSYAIHPNRGLCVWTGPITLLHDTAILFSTADLSLNLAGPISGAGGLIRRNRGTLILSAANSYTGDTTINVGVLEIAHSDAICHGKITIGSGASNPSSVIVRSSVNYPIYNRVNVDIKSDGLLELNGGIGWINNLAFDRGQLTTGTGLLKLMGNVTATENSSADWSARFSGRVQLYYNRSFNIAANASFDFSADAGGTGGITKIGAGTLNMSGANTFTGNTVVSGGLLQVNGSQASSAVTVGAAGTLGGTGTVGSINNLGTVAPGMSPGQLTTGSVALQSGSIFEVELDGTPSADGDRINTTGSVDLGESSIAILWGFEPSVGDSFTIIDNDGADAVVNIFSGLTNGATVVVGQVEATIHYDGGTGNDVVLAVTALRDPEPLQISSVAVVGETLQLAWTGGASQYYAVEKNTTLTNENWNVVANLTNTTHATLPITTTNGFYRVRGGN